MLDCHNLVAGHTYSYEKGNEYDDMGGSRGGAGGLDHPEKSQKLGFPSKTGHAPLGKSQSYQASIQCFAGGPMMARFSSARF